MSLDDDMVWMERFLRNNFGGRSSRIYKTFTAMWEEIKKQKGNPKEPLEFKPKKKKDV